MSSTGKIRRLELEVACQEGRNRLNEMFLELEIAKETERLSAVPGGETATATAVTGVATAETAGNVRRLARGAGADANRVGGGTKVDVVRVCLCVCVCF